MGPLPVGVPVLYDYSVKITYIFTSSGDCELSGWRKIEEHKTNICVYPFFSLEVCPFICYQVANKALIIEQMCTRWVKLVVAFYVGFVGLWGGGSYTSGNS